MGGGQPFFCFSLSFSLSLSSPPPPLYTLYYLLFLHLANYSPPLRGLSYFFIFCRNFTFSVTVVYRSTEYEKQLDITKSNRRNRTTNNSSTRTRDYAFLLPRRCTASLVCVPCGRAAGAGHVVNVRDACVVPLRRGRSRVSSHDRWG